MSTRYSLVILVIVGLIAPFATRAQPIAPLSIEGDAGRGAALAYTCSGCHGVETAVNAYPTYHVPKLGGQNADYIEVALQDYRQGTRPHPTMQAQAATMSDQDIADIASYFASVGGEPETGISSAGADTVSAGEEKSTTCQACHGANGEAVSPQWPNLAGQHSSYLFHALKQYQSAERTDATMGGLVGQLDDETLEQLAAYYAAMPGLHPTDR